jgi:hypothetical protein
VFFLLGGTAHAQTLPPNPTVQFFCTHYTVSEDCGLAEITVTLSGDAGDNTVSVQYATSDGTAKAGIDYDTATGTLTFLPGATSQTFLIPIRFVVKIDASVALNLTLSNPVNADLGDPSTSMLTIYTVQPLVTVQAAGGAICSGGLNTPIHQTTVTVTVTDGTNPWPGVSMYWSTTAGTLSDASGTTDENGQATTTLTSNNLASEPQLIYTATVGATLTDNPSIIATAGVEFQPTVVSMTADPTDLVTGETSALGVSVSWNGQAVAQHALEWKIARAWDDADNLVYDGTGAPPPDYGSIQPGASAQTDGNGMGTAVYESGPKGGRVELQAADKAVQKAMSGDNPKDKKEVKPKAPTLVIKRQKDGEAMYKDIDASNRDVLPGEYIDLKMVLDPAPKMVGSRSWAAPGTIFKDYTADNKKAELTPMTAADMKGETIQYYWADSADGREVVAKATIGKVEVTGKATLNVKELTVTYTKALGKVQLDPAVPEIRLKKTAATKRGGIDFDATVDVPAGFANGKWQFVQTINPQIFYWDAAKKYRWSMNGRVNLDTDYPYVGPFDTGKGAKTDDSPGQNLTGMVKYQRADVFKMYVMFTPAGAKSKEVPLQVVDWSWQGTATFDDKTKKWALSGDAQDAKDPTKTSAHPTWTTNFKDGTWEEDKGGGFRGRPRGEPGAREDTELVRAAERTGGWRQPVLAIKGVGLRASRDWRRGGLGRGPVTERVRGPRAQETWPVPRTAPKVT